MEWGTTSVLLARLGRPVRSGPTYVVPTPGTSHFTYLPKLLHQLRVLSIATPHSVFHQYQHLPSLEQRYNRVIYTNMPFRTCGIVCMRARVYTIQSRLCTDALLVVSTDFEPDCQPLELGVVYQLRRQLPQSPNTPEGIAIAGAIDGRAIHCGWVAQKDLPIIVRPVLAGLQLGEAVNLRPFKEGQKWGALDSFGRQARWIRGEADWWITSEPREVSRPNL